MDLNRVALPHQCRVLTKICLFVFFFKKAVFRKFLAQKEAFMQELDRYDRAILRELQTDGRLSNTELAQRVGLSAAPCWRRVRALEASGHILGYRAVIDRHKIGLDVLAFVRIDAERNSSTMTRALEDAIRQVPEIIGCHYISGSGTFELEVVAKDLQSFSTFVREVLMNLPHVKDLQTSFSLGEIKRDSALPLPAGSP